MCEDRNNSAIFPDKPSIQWSIDWQYVIKKGVNQNIMPFIFISQFQTHREYHSINIDV